MHDIVPFLVWKFILEVNQFVKWVFVLLQTSDQILNFSHTFIILFFAGLGLDFLELLVKGFNFDFPGVDVLFEEILVFFKWVLIVFFVWVFASFVLFGDRLDVFTDFNNLLLVCDAVVVETRFEEIFQSTVRGLTSSVYWFPCWYSVCISLSD